MRRAVWLLVLWVVLSGARARAADCVLAFDGMDISDSADAGGQWLIVAWSLAGREVRRDQVALRRGFRLPELEVACTDGELTSATFELVSLEHGELLRDAVLFPPGLEAMSFSRAYQVGTVSFNIQRRRSSPQLAAELAPATAGSAVRDWAQTFTASRDPEAGRPDISVDIQPSLTVPGAWKISLSEQIANAERPLTVELDGATPKRVLASAFSGDVWGEAWSDLDDDVSDPGWPQLVAALEVVDVFELPELGIQLGLYRRVRAGEHVDPALRYLRARMDATVTGADVALEAHRQLRR